MKLLLAFVSNFYITIEEAFYYLLSQACSSAKSPEVCSQIPVNIQNNDELWNAFTPLELQLDQRFRTNGQISRLPFSIPASPPPIGYASVLSVEPLTDVCQPNNTTVPETFQGSLAWEEVKRVGTPDRFSPDLVDYMLSLILTDEQCHAELTNYQNSLERMKPARIRKPKPVYPDRVVTTSAPIDFSPISTPTLSYTPSAVSQKRRDAIQSTVQPLIKKPRTSTLDFPADLSLLTDLTEAPDDCLY